MGRARLDNRTHLTRTHLTFVGAVAGRRLGRATLQHCWYIKCQAERLPLPVCVRPTTRPQLSVRSIRTGAGEDQVWRQTGQAGPGLSTRWLHESQDRVWAMTGCAEPPTSMHKTQGWEWA